MHFTTPILLLTLVATAASIPMRVVSFNIRYAATKLEANEKAWSVRKPEVIASMNSMITSVPSGSSAIFGLQEVLSGQLDDIKKGLGSKWASIGSGRDDGKKAGEFSPILYNTAVVTLIYSEMKWLSPTPNTVSFGWGAGSRRVVTIGVFEDKISKKRFLHANTHLDNVSSQARSEGVKVVMARIAAVRAQWKNVPFTITGDFNSAPGADAYKTLQDTKLATEIWDSGAKRVGANQLTYTGFSTKAISRIDFVWLGNEGVKGVAVEIRGNDVKGMFISDHRPVAADVTVA